MAEAVADDLQRQSSPGGHQEKLNNQAGMSYPRVGSGEMDHPPINYTPAER